MITNGRLYLAWFLSAIAFAVAFIFLFNLIADDYILRHRVGPSIETVSGFERVLKPAWLDTLKPSLVFVGSSRVRDGFDPALVEPALHLKSFNYGVSSATPYEVRRFAQDAAAQPSVTTLVIALDVFAFGTRAHKFSGGFDDLRLAVTPEGTPTPRRGLWLFTTRYLSGGALGMHALGLYLLQQLAPRETAADRPDLFEAYDHMTSARLRADLDRRGERTMDMEPWQRQELDAMLAGLCPSRAKIYLFFPPDNYAVIARYLANDGAGFAAFKDDVRRDVLAHNASCLTKVVLFDFMTANALTTEPMKKGRSDDYVDLIHFRPPVGVRLLKRMFGIGDADDNLGEELTPPAEARAAYKVRASSNIPSGSSRRIGGNRE